MTFGVIMFYLIFWIVLCEKISLETIALGIILCFVINTVNKKFFNIDLSNRKSGVRLGFKRLGYWIEYIFILVKEIVVANINVAIIVLSPSMNISPSVIKIKTSLKSDFYRTILANSITLTPGTITVDMVGEEMVVHCLKQEYKDDLMNSKFEKVLLKMEG